MGICACRLNCALLGRALPGASCTCFNRFGSLRYGMLRTHWKYIPTLFCNTHTQGPNVPVGYRDHIPLVPPICPPPFGRHLGLAVGLWCSFCQHSPQASNQGLWVTTSMRRAARTRTCVACGFIPARCRRHFVDVHARACGGSVEWAEGAAKRTHDVTNCLCSFDGITRALQCAGAATAHYPGTAIHQHVCHHLAAGNSNLSNNKKIRTRRPAGGCHSFQMRVPHAALYTHAPPATYSSEGRAGKNSRP